MKVTRATISADRRSQAATGLDPTGPHGPGHGGREAGAPWTGPRSRSPSAPPTGHVDRRLPAAVRLLSGCSCSADTHPCGTLVAALEAEQRTADAMAPRRPVRRVSVHLRVRPGWTCGGCGLGSALTLHVDE
jgi:hypothetical protein